MNYTLKNGTKLEGSLEQIMSICKSVGETVDLKQIEGKETPEGYYMSGSKGLIKISDMNSMHLRNALLKLSKDYFENLGSKKTLSNYDFLNEFVGLADNPKVIELYNALGKK